MKKRTMTLSGIYHFGHYNYGCMVYPEDNPELAFELLVCTCPFLPMCDIDINDPYTRKAMSRLYKAARYYGEDRVPNTLKCKWTDKGVPFNPEIEY